MKIKNLKILIYGEPYEWAMALNLQDSFEKLQHHAEIFDYTKHMYRSKKFTLKNRILDRILYYKICKEINNEFLNVARNGNFDFVLILKGVHIFPETLLTIKKFIPFIVNWNPDDFFNPLNNSKNLLSSFSIFDCIFSPRDHLFKEYYKLGAKKVKLLNWYYLPKYEISSRFDQTELNKFEKSIVFIGTWSLRRESILFSLKDFNNLKIYGSGWNKASSRFRNNINCKPPIFSNQMSKIMCLSKININILTTENRDTTNLRNFEIPAFKGFQIAEHSDAIKNIFIENSEVVLYNSPEDLASKCEYYLNNKEQHKLIKSNGHNRVTNGSHTILDRAKQIIDTIYNEL